MGRRGLLLVILGLVACAGDQPTEPTTAPEGPQGVLAPPPAPATELSGDLTANEGGPSHIDLGDYASPVYSKVTVSGLLSYQGAGGYLPGSGEIDASGIVIQNQCDLLVVVRSATGYIGGATNCPSQPRQIDSYVKYSIVNGHVDAYRTTGPPGSCWKYPAPCIHFSGSQTITVEPQEGNLILTPSKTFVAPGTMIAVTAKGVWAENNTTPVPMAGREWRWEGSGPEVGGGHTKVCAAVDGFKCFVPVYQSGRVVLEALVNGKVKTAKVWIRVEGGDSVPPDDSLPCGENVCCGEPGTPGPQLAACEDEDPAPTATVTCQAQVTRGEPVSCTVALAPQMPFTLVGWKAEGTDGQLAEQVDGAIYPAGATPSWEGPAVLNTKVSATVSVQLRRRRATVAATPYSYVVTPRSWAFPPPGTPPEEGNGDLYPDTPRDYGTGFSHDLGDIHLFFGGRPNNALVDFIAMAGPGAVTDGPNTGWYYARTPIPAPRTVVHISNHLGSTDAWFRQHRGQRLPRVSGQPQRYYCTPAQMNEIRDKVRLHEGSLEGVTGSHQDIFVDFISTRPIQSILEERVAHKSGSTHQQFYEELVGTYNAWQGELDQAQSLPDLRGNPAFVTISCVLFLDNQVATP